MSRAAHATTTERSPITPTARSRTRWTNESSPKPCWTPSPTQSTSIDVDRPVAGAQLNSDRTPVLHDAVSATEQPFHEGVDRRRVDEHIQITMRSGLGTVQSVNGPSAVDLVDD